MKIKVNILWNSRGFRWKNNSNAKLKKIWPHFIAFCSVLAWILFFRKHFYWRDISGFGTEKIAMLLLPLLRLLDMSSLYTCNLDLTTASKKSSLQVNLCQKLLFLHQLTDNMTTDCSLNYQFSTWKFQAQNMLCT